MHMLEAGGLPVVTDGLRTADGFNPGGYREDERAKNLSGNQDWILESRGKALKILVPEIGKIRPDVPLRVLFMQRPITEVVSSQERMRGIDPAITHRSFPLELALALEQERTKALDFLRSRALTEVLEIAYEALLENPPAVTQKIIRFLHLPLQADAMARVPKKTHS